MVKARWRLNVDTLERAALKRILAACPARTVSVAVLAPSTGSPAPTSAPTPATGSAPTLGAACDPNYTGYCVPVSDDDLDCGDIAHRVTVVGIDKLGFDGNKDGFGCESYP